jgi:hypothetical protein
MNEHVKANSAGPIIAIVMIFGLGYAVLRYHIVGPVPWKDFPFFILNKGISLSAFVLLTAMLLGAAHIFSWGTRFGLSQLAGTEDYHRSAWWRSCFLPQAMS